jgi:hypothetical protein
MSECVQFAVSLTDADGSGEVTGSAEVAHGFTHNQARDGSVIFTIKSSPLSAAIHTTEESLIAFAMKILKELTP